MLQKRDEGRAVVAVGEGAALHPQDLQPPVLVLGQAQSKGVTEGKLQRLDTQEEFDYLDVVPLVVRPSRTKWAAGPFSRDSRPECWSDDGVKGSARLLAGDQALYVGRPCLECPFYTARPWEEHQQEGWCSPGYNVLLVGAGDSSTYIMRLRGTATRVARLLAARGVFQSAVVRLSAEKTETDQGLWYQLKAKTQRVLTEADRDMVKAQYQDYASAAVVETATPLESATEPMSPPARQSGPSVTQAEMKRDNEDLYGPEKQRSAPSKPLVQTLHREHWILDSESQSELPF